MTRQRRTTILCLFGAALALAHCHPPIPTPVQPAIGGDEERPAAGTDPRPERFSDR